MSEPAAFAETARTIVREVLGRDVDDMELAPSDSHRVYIGADVVVKMIEAHRHSRLDRELGLASHLPMGILPRVLANGVYQSDTGDIRFVCYERAQGSSPGMGMPTIDASAARLMSEQAVRRLEELHHWTPSRAPSDILSEPIDHGGFVSRTELLHAVDRLGALNRHGVIESTILHELRRIAERAPDHAATNIPVHADCHWGNWLALETRVTALLDFEWARFGEPLDDWFFLARFSGQHVDAVLEIIARETSISSEMLRAGCEVREVAHLASDLCIAFEHPDGRDRMAAERLQALELLVNGRYWWRGAS